MKVKLKEAQIHLTNRCNLKCIFCEVPFFRTKDLSDEKWYQIIEELCELKPLALTLSGGGEPLLRPKLLLHAIKKVKEVGTRALVITNGTLVTSTFAKKLVEYRCDEWRESIHTPFVKADSFVRGKSMLTQSFEGIKLIAHWKRKLESDFPQLVIWMTLTKHTITHIRAMIKKCTSLGVNSLFLRIVNPPENKKVYPSLAQRQKLLRKLPEYKSVAEKSGIELRCGFLPRDILPHLPDGGKLTCLIPFHELVVFADGRVAVCCNFIKDDTSSPGVESLKGKGLREIWFGDKFNNFRKCMLDGILFDRCVACTPDFKMTDREYKEKLIIKQINLSNESASLSIF
jgi:MoaA/NifB/PqqE/SkfB family radical SAM enzyme